jgi:dihydrofolate reductase/thymidylate synthase
MSKTILIVAFDSKKGIARANQIPWDIKEDYNFFQDVSKKEYIKGKKNVCIMGKNTWKALPEQHRGLKDRINIVISSTMTQEELEKDNIAKSEAYLAKNYKESFKICEKLDVGYILICGGSSIYKEALKGPNDYIYLTEINGDYACDTFFPFQDIYYQITHVTTGFISYAEMDQKTFMLKDHKKDQMVSVKFTKYMYMYNKNVNFSLVNKEERQYLDLLEDILKNGDFRQTRNAKTWSLFGKTLEFNLINFPLLTTKKMFFRGVFEELLFFLRGDTNTNHLSEIGVKIWEPNTSRDFLDKMGLKEYEPGDMGNLYGYNWLHFGYPYEGMNANYNGKGFDQIKYCLGLIKNDPSNRRIMMTTFDPANSHKGVLFPCHSIVVQFYVEKGNKLSATCYNRSQDCLLGLPFNAPSTSLLIHMFCEVINNDSEYKGNKLSPGRLVMNLGDVHIYQDHYSCCIREVLREPFAFPQIKFNRKVTELTDFKFEDVELINYHSYPAIPAKMVA